MQIPGKRARWATKFLANLWNRLTRLDGLELHEGHVSMGLVFALVSLQKFPLDMLDFWMPTMIII